MSKETFAEQMYEYADAYIDQESKKAMTEALDKVHEQGCMCKNCIGTAVYLANSWIAFLDPEDKYPRFEHDGKKAWVGEFPKAGGARVYQKKLGGGDNYEQ